MSSITVQAAAQGTVLSTPDAPRSSLFTCLACHVAFKTADIQREHYRSDWHRYNLKRKMVELPPVSAEMFTQKVVGKHTLGPPLAPLSLSIYLSFIFTMTLWMVYYDLYL